MSKITTQCEPYLSAPEGMAVYHQNPSYTQSDGVRMVEGVKYETISFDKSGPFCYHPRIFRRFSEDNGRTWTAETPDFCTHHPDWEAGAVRIMPIHILDSRRNRLICVYCTHEFNRHEPFLAPGNRRSRSMRMIYRVSRDGGASWSPARQVIDERPGHDALHFGPGLDYGVRGVQTDMGSIVYLPDGSFLLALSTGNVPVPLDTVGPMHAEGYTAVLCVRAQWDGDTDDTLRWRFGEWVLVPPAVSVRGAQEPAITHLGGQRVFMTIRCQGDERFGIYSTRQTALSEDGGMTWSQPEPLRYDDGSPVHTPASLSSFFTSSRTGKTWFIGNILDHPVHAQMPRYPLCVAEFDPLRRCLRRDSVTVLIDRPHDAPRERRYTNWGQYEDRETGDLVLTLPEQPRDTDFSAMTRPAQFTADSLRLRVDLVS